MLALLELRHLRLVTLTTCLGRGDRRLRCIGRGHVGRAVASIALDPHLVVLALLPIGDHVGRNRAVTSHALLADIGGLGGMRARERDGSQEDDKQNSGRGTQHATGHDHLGTSKEWTTRTSTAYRQVEASSMTKVTYQRADGTKACAPIAIY